MDDDYRPGALGYERFQLCLVNVERIGTDVGEYRFRAAQDEGVDGGDEGEGGDDDLVPLPDIEQDRAHLQGGGAGRSEEHRRNRQFPLQQI